MKQTDVALSSIHDMHTALGRRPISKAWLKSHCCRDLEQNPLTADLFHHWLSPHAGRRFLRKLCFGNYVSESMFRKLCFGNYVSKTMFRKLCFGNHVSETMFRKPRFLRKLKRILRKLKTILRKLEKFLWKLHVKLGIQPIDGRVFFTWLCTFWTQFKSRGHWDRLHCLNFANSPSKT